MKTRIAPALAFAALASASSMSIAGVNSCLVDIQVVGLNVRGYHGVTVNTPTYDVWDFLGELWRVGVLMSGNQAHEPNMGYINTQTLKVNCLRYEAITSALIDGPAQPDFYCENNRFLTPDTRPPSC